MATRAMGEFAPVFPPHEADPCLALGCPEQMVGSRAQAPGLGGQRLCQGMRGALSTPSCTSPPRMNITAGLRGGVQGKAKPEGWGWGGRNCGGSWWRGSISQGCLQPSHPLSQHSGPIHSQTPLPRASVQAEPIPSFPEPFPNILQKPH